MKKLMVILLLMISTITFSWNISRSGDTKAITQKSTIDSGKVSVVNFEGKWKLVVTNPNVKKFIEHEIAIVGVSIDDEKQQYLVGMARKDTNMVIVDLTEEDMDKLLPMFRRGNKLIIATAYDNYMSSASVYLLKGFTASYSEIK